MSIYSDSSLLFENLVLYNEENIEYMGSYQIPITNIYYISLLDPNNDEINDFIKHLNNSDNKNPYENVKININIDDEQFFKINLIKSSLQQINKDICEILENAENSNSKIVLLMDIGFIFKLIKSFEDSDTEIHLYDFIMHKLKRKINKLFILDTNSILKLDNLKMSSVYDELRFYLLKEKIQIKNNGDDNDVTIYKSHNSLYWKILDLNQKIEYIEIPEDSDLNLEKNMKLVEIDNEESILTTISLSKLRFSNLFELHSFVLNPIHKLKIMSTI